MPLELPMSALSIVGAKWRREVPPSRRLTAREQSLPWAILSFPAHSLSGQPPRSRRWHPGCHRCLLKGCEALVPAVPTPGPLLQPGLPKSCTYAGAAGMPANATRPPPTAKNSGESRPDAIAAVSGNDHLLLNRRRQPTTSS